uniref:Mitochondrial ribosomal protein L1 n=1 Tax=Plectus sambesii TaxID=2011161 RepID=A0A914WI12_9BILA
MLSLNALLAGGRAALAARWIPAASSLLLPNVESLQMQQVRGRKRAHKQPLSRAQKQARREAKLAKELERKKYTFMERVRIAKMHKLQSPSHLYPGRMLPEQEETLLENPPCNVYVRSAVKTQYYSVRDAILMHRESQQPAMFNHPKAPIRLRLELNMSTERSTKKVADTTEIVPVPYTFTHGQKRSILAFVADLKLQEEALAAGAEFALGPEIVKKIVKGQFRTEDFDFAVAHTDMAMAIPPIRGILKKKFPTKLNGGLGDDIAQLVEKFKTGVQYTIKGDPIYPDWGLCDTIVGKLDMPPDELEMNVNCLIEAVCKHRNAVLGPFINRAVLMVVPGDEYFSLKIDHLLPVPTAEEIEKFEKQKKKKKKEKKEEKLLAEEEGAAAEVEEDEADDVSPAPAAATA